MQNKYYTVSAVVNSTLIDNKETNHLYPLYLHYALEGLREMHFDFAREVKTVKIQVNGYRAIDWPSDYVGYVKIAVQCGERLEILGLASNLAKIHSKDDCGDKVANLANPGVQTANGTNLDGGYWLNNYGGGTLFAYSTIQLPYKGFFEEVRESRQIQFSSDIPEDTEIYLEYISDGFNPTSASYVNPYAYNYIKAYINFKRVDTDDNASQALKFEKGQALHFARKRAITRIMNINPIDIINSSREGYKMTNKI